MCRPQEGGTAFCGQFARFVWYAIDRPTCIRYNILANNMQNKYSLHFAGIETISIYDWFGYDAAIQDRYVLVGEAGFDGVLLWWSDGFGRGADYRAGVWHARNAGPL